MSDKIININLTEFNQVLADVNSLKVKGDFIPDYKESKDFCLKVTTPARTSLTAAHKIAKEPYLEGGRRVDAKKNELMAIIEKVEAPHKKLYKDKDKKTKEDKEKFNRLLDDKVSKLYNYRNQTIGKTPDEIRGLIQECGETDTSGESFYNKSLEATKARAETLALLEHALEIAVKVEYAEALIKSEKPVVVESAVVVEKPMAVKSVVVSPFANTSFSAEVKAGQKHIESTEQLIIEAFVKHGFDFTESTKIFSLISSNKIPQVNIEY